MISNAINPKLHNFFSREIVKLVEWSVLNQIGQANIDAHLKKIGFQCRIETIERHFLLRRGSRYIYRIYTPIFLDDG